MAGDESFLDLLSNWIGLYEIGNSIRSINFIDDLRGGTVLFAHDIGADFFESRILKIFDLYRVQYIKLGSSRSELEFSKERVQFWLIKDLF